MTSCVITMKHSSGAQKVRSCPNTGILILCFTRDARYKLNTFTYQLLSSSFQSQVNLFKLLTKEIVNKFHNLAGMNCFGVLSVYMCQMH